jgi:hypothetical protein
MHKCFCILIEISPITLNLLDTSFFYFSSLYLCYNFSCIFSNNFFCLGILIEMFL